MRSASARLSPAAVVLGALALSGGAAVAQDSVAVAAGGNDAMSAYDGSGQRVRYVVDLVGVSSSWGNTFVVGPIIKASRDTDPLFKTQIPGSAAVSPAFLRSVAFPNRNYNVWSTAGAGVNGANNSAPSTVGVTGYDYQFGVALSDLSLAPTNIIGALVGRSTSQPSRLFVDRVAALSSRGSAGAADTSTVSLGAVDAGGNVFVRADNFNTLPATTTRVLGENIVRIAMSQRGLSVNTLSAAGGVNTAADAGATSYIISNEATPTNTPSGVLSQPTGGTPFALVLDFANRFRAGSATGNVVTTTTHIAPGMSAHRGNPSYSPVSVLGGAGGTVASLALPNAAGAKVNAFNAFGLQFAGPAVTPTVAAGTQRSAVMPSPITSPTGFIANVGNGATFRQYLSQTSFRGGNGQVGVGSNAAGNLVLAAVASDPSAGDFVAVATMTPAGVSTWTVAAHAGQHVLDGPGSATRVGTIDTPAPIFSAPAVDLLGNVYFVATWKPNLTPATTGLFKAVNRPSGYEIELLLTVGQTITGANSATPYQIAALELADSDSVASGALHSQHLIQAQYDGSPADPASPQAFGGVVVNAAVAYQRPGSVVEQYDAMLFVGPAMPTATPSCPCDFNGTGGVTVQDIYDFLTAWNAGLPSADFNGVGGVTVQDIYDFLTCWNSPPAGC